MALPPAPSLNAFHGVATGVPGVALIITLCRLYYRIKRKLAWWDDLLIGFASLWMTLLVIFIWILNASFPQRVKVAAYYVCTYTFTLSNYFARLSILVGIFRIAPNPKIRTVLKAMASFFVLIMCVLLAQKFWVCDGNSHMAKTWKSEPNPSCHLGLQVALTELVTDIVTDAFLVITPITFLSRAKLKPSQKRRLYAVFSASVATTITSIVQDYLILAAGGLREITASMLEVSVAITVANLPVIVSWVYRLMRKRDGDPMTSRFATDYDHNRRAKPGLWAQTTGDLVSSSNPTARGQFSSVGIQLGDARYSTMRGHLIDTDLRQEHKADDMDEKAVDSFDDQAPRSIKVDRFEPESSYDSGHYNSVDRKEMPEELEDGGAAFNMSAILFGDGRSFGRDTDDEPAAAERHHHLPGLHTAMDNGEAVPMYQAYNEYPTDSPQFAETRIPIAAEYHALDSPHPSAHLPTGAQFTLPSPPPAAASVPLRQQQQRGRARSLRRSPSSATRLERPATSPLDKKSQRQYSSRSHSPSTPPRGLFGGSGGVLVQQQIHVVTDPEDANANPNYRAPRIRHT